jgi:hypothetical protein
MKYEAVIIDDRSLCMLMDQRKFALQQGVEIKECNGIKITAIII